MKAVERVKSKKHSLDKKGLFWGFLGLALFGALAFSIINKQAIDDQIVAHYYRNNPTVQHFASTLKTTEQGTFLLRASRAQINDQAAFNQNCSGLVEQTVVLGCYADRRIYVYNVQNMRLDGIREVTMAHELLHAAYERLSGTERNKLNKLIEKQYATVTDESFRSVVKSYEKFEPGQQLNELHSMLATEMPQLSPELESYYARYFKDRKAIAAVAARYEGVFKEIEKKQKDLVAELNGIADELDVSVPAYERRAETLMADIDSFNAQANGGAYRTAGSFEAARSKLLARQSALEAERLRINAAVERYDAGKKELEALNAQAAELNKSIDSLKTRKQLPKV